MTLWDAIDYSSPGPLSKGFSRQNTGVGFHALLQGIFSTRAEPTCLESPALAGRFFTTNDIWEAHINYRHLLYCLADFLHLWRPKDFNSLPNTDKAKSSVTRVHKDTVGQGKMEVSSELRKKLQGKLRTATCTRRTEQDRHISVGFPSPWNLSVSLLIPGLFQFPLQSPSFDHPPCISALEQSSFMQNSSV